MTTPWSKCGANFLRDDSDWAYGQGTEAPDRVHLRKIIQGLSPCTVLDVGCGTGITMDGLAENKIDCTYTGLDFTPEFVDAARARHPGANFFCKSLFATDWPEGTYDVVTARAVLEHVDDPLRAMDILYKAAGKLLVVAFFIAPGRTRREVTEDGFIQQRVSRRGLLNVVKGGQVKIHEYEHVGQNWSIWEVWKA